MANKMERAVRSVGVMPAAPSRAHFGSVLTNAGEPHLRAHAARGIPVSLVVALFQLRFARDTRQRILPQKSDQTGIPLIAMLLGGGMPITIWFGGHEYAYQNSNCVPYRDLEEIPANGASAFQIFAGLAA